MIKLKILFVIINMIVILNLYSLTEELINAIRIGDVDNVRLLIENGKDININEHNQNEATALMVACLSGSYEMVKLLIEKGSDVNEKGRFNMSGAYFTALEYAVFYGNLEMVKLIVDKGADFNIICGSLEDRTGGDIFGYALQLAKYDMANYLVRKGYDINKDPWNSTARTYLIGWSGCGPMLYPDAINRVKFLVENGAGMDIKDNDGNTALIQAVKKDVDMQIVSYLLSKGAKVNIKNKEGKSAMDYALERQKNKTYEELDQGCNIKLIGLLKKAGAKEGKYL